MSSQQPEYSELVPFRTFGSLSEAEVLAAVLNNADVFAIVPVDDALDGLEAVVRAGVPVLIHPTDREKAEAALAEARAAGEQLAEGEIPPQARGDA